MIRYGSSSQQIQATKCNRGIVRKRRLKGGRQKDFLDGERCWPLAVQKGIRFAWKLGYENVSRKNAYSFWDTLALLPPQDIFYLKYTIRKLLCCFFLVLFGLGFLLGFFLWFWGMVGVGFYFWLLSGKWRFLNKIRVVSGSPLSSYCLYKYYSACYLLHLARETVSDKRLNHHHQRWRSF